MIVRTASDYWVFDISGVFPYPPPGRVIWLDVGPTIDLDPGAYTLTAAINLATARDWIPRAPCKGFPADLASRSFQTTIELRDRALDLYSVSVDDHPRGSGFSLYRVGRFLSFEMEYGFLSEDLPGFRYLMIGGTAPTTEPAIDTGASLTVPFSGGFQYCQLKSARGIAGSCEQVPPEQIVAFHSCGSDRATMTFTKR